MIIKKREIPLSIQKLQALTRRLPKQHPKQALIKEHLTKKLAGYKGEYSIDYPLSFLPESSFFILHDIRLYNGTHFFQMDTVLLSRRFALILEVKNIAGTLYFDQFLHQLIRTLDGQEEAFPDPIIQIERQKQQLNKWFVLNRFPDVPVHSLVIISNPNTLIKIPPNSNLHQIVIRSEYLPTKIEQLQQQYSLEVLTDKELKRIIRKMKHQHIPLDSAILEQFDVSKSDLLKGVFCPSCSYLPIHRIYGTWFCPNCSNKNKNAHISSIMDYRLLVNSTFTNSDIRDFLQITSPAFMGRLLRCRELSYSGSTKDRVYFFKK